MNFLENCSILRGAAVSDEACLIVALNDRLAEERTQHSIPLSCKGRAWSAIADEPILPWIAADIARTDDASGALVIAGWGGQVLVIEGRACRREAMSRRDALAVSVIRSLCSIGNAVYAAGMSRQVYERTDADGWRQLDDNMVNDSGAFGVGFNAIDGFDRTEIYAAGLDGEIWSYDGTTWRKIDAPTNVHLHCICCAADGVAHIGGRGGILVSGRHDHWDASHIGTDATIWDVHWFKGVLYLILDDGIWSYVDGAAEQIEGKLCQGDFLNFSSAGNRLWAFGRKKIACFDGSTWTGQRTDIARDGVQKSVLDVLDTRA